MNLLLLFIPFFYVQSFQDYSKEYYNCINPNKIVNSSSYCTSIKIPESDGYKCCSVKVEFNNYISYSCFPFEIDYIKAQSDFSEFNANKGFEPLFYSTGGQIEIECGEDMISTQKYEKMSDEYLNCYKNNINEVDNENECYKYDMDDNKCCFIEKTRKDANGTIIKDKRCYIIQNEYFTKEKNMTNYLLDNSLYQTVEQIKDTNILIKCKNNDAFYFNSLLENNPNNPNIEEEKKENKKSGLNKGAITAIIIIVVIVLVGVGILIFYLIKKRKKKEKGKNVNIFNKYNKENNNNINNFDSNNNINSNNKIS